MPAYIIAGVEVTNQDGYQEYSAQVSATLEPFGGRFIVRTSSVEALEGDAWFTPRLVVLEFPSIDQARGWYHSEAYQRILPIRQANSTGRLAIVEGYEPAR